MAQSEGMAKDVSHRWKPEESGGIPISEETDFMLKMVKRQRRSLYNDKEVNSLRRYNYCEYILTQIF